MTYCFFKLKCNVFNESLPKSSVCQINLSGVTMKIENLSRIMYSLHFNGLIKHTTDMKDNKNKSLSMHFSILFNVLTR